MKEKCWSCNQRFTPKNPELFCSYCPECRWKKAIKGIAPGMKGCVGYRVNGGYVSESATVVRLSKIDGSITVRTDRNELIREHISCFNKYQNQNRESKQLQLF